MPHRQRRTVAQRCATIASLAVALTLAACNSSPTNAGARTSEPSGAGPEQPAAADPAPRARTLVLYDTTGPWGWLGEVYAIQAGHLASHFGGWTARPVASYRAGDLAAFDLAVYVASTFGEPLPTPFLDDVLSARVPVIWAGDNIEQLAARGTERGVTLGFTPDVLDFSSIAHVRYKQTLLSRYADNADGIVTCKVAPGARVEVIAEAVKGDGATLPWAVRVPGLTYLAENPFPYASESDRYLVLADLLFEALAPGTPERHRALVRIEDVSPNTPPERLRALTSYLAGAGVPFAIALVPEYLDPLGLESPDGRPVRLGLADVPVLVEVLAEATANGAVLVQHGTTHQLGSVPNPYDAASGSDFEFWSASLATDGSVVYGGPVPDDSGLRAATLVQSGLDAIAGARLPRPVAFEYPHYAGSSADSAAIAAILPKAYQRGFYFAGLLSGGGDPTRFFGQIFPYEVTDVYGWQVIPENIGDYQPDDYPGAPARPVEALLANARANLVVRDGFASFFFHPQFDVATLDSIVGGIRDAGYVFVSPADLSFAPQSGR